MWVHPDDPEQSIVAFTLKNGGLFMTDLEANILQTVTPATYGEFRYNNVDVVYNFRLGGQRVDLFVTSDRHNDTLAVFRIDPDTREITNVTSPTMPETLFGVDDGEQTAYGLGIYANPYTDKVYAFVTQADGNHIAQVELTADGNGLVTGTVVRMLELPVPTGDPADSQSEGIVADRFLGYLYVAMENEVGILRFNAEPDAGNDYTVIHSVDKPYLQPDIEGLTIYYGAGDTGYLLASSQGNNTYPIFARGGDNAYLGSFVVADSGDIDQANESDGADVLNVPLGPDFPQGLLIVQDGANDPQNVVPDDEELENNSTNFKFVRWDSVANAFADSLLIDPGSYNPRYPMRALLPTISNN
ncbi:MAG: phytase [Chloroflexota bacterium]